MATMAELQRVHFSKEQSDVHAQCELVITLLTELSSLVAFCEVSLKMLTYTCILLCYAT